MSTYLAKKGEVDQKWFVVDASGQVLGRLAAKLATIAMGKHKPTYTPHVESGDFVVVLNAEKVVVTGRKADTMEYDNYSKYPGGRRLISYKRMNELHPERALQVALKRMLPKNKIGRNMLLKVKIYRGGEHPHAAQRPEPLNWN
ncbi:MAG: 50S ribosomal protein L13 [Tepidisphaeraceae bacterium]